MASKPLPRDRGPARHIWGPLLREWSRLPEGVQHAGTVIARTFRGYYTDSCGTYAAAIAYYAIFSLIPLALIILSVAGLVVDPNRVVNFVFDQFPLEETDSVRDNVTEIVNRAQGSSAVGLGFGVIALVWTSSGIFGAVRRGLNAANHARPRAFWRGKLLDVMVIPVAGILISLSVSLSGLAQVVVQRTGGVGPLDATEAWRAMSLGFSAVISFVMFGSLYRFVPSQRPRWQEALASAAFATVAFETTKVLYTIIASLTPYTRDTAVYAGIGTALAFLFWMYLNASILLLGAEFGRALRTIRTTDHEAQSFLAPFRRELRPMRRSRRRG
ncbi:MAG: YihY/virulence factor BrkB family protein [Dehalococcoidia bacterium]